MRRPGPSLLWLGVAIVAALALVAVLAPIIAPAGPHAATGAPLQAPSARNLLGTNDVGQDLFSQLVWGARSTLVVAGAAALVAVAVGVVVGCVSGLLGGLADLVAMRVVDVFLALPALPLLILIAALLGPSAVGMVAVIALAGWPRIARLVRAETLGLRERGFVRAARGFGGGPWYLVRRHVAPALGPIVAAGFVNWAALAVGLQAGLAFLGLGDPTQVSWGSILNRALSHEGIYFGSAWTWWVLPAGIAITLGVVGLALIGVGLEPHMNARARRVR